MEYLTLKEKSEEWDISPRRIRKLIDDGRIEGAKKVNGSWLIPDNSSKPMDKRRKIEEDNFIINLPEDFLERIEEKKKVLDSKRPLPKHTLKSLEEKYKLEWTYNSNGIEGNTLTLRETKVALEGITIAGKNLREHLEAINHKDAIEFLEETISKKEELSELFIKELHSIVLGEIDKENAGRYRKENVIISGAKHIPPESALVPECMEKLMMRYINWKEKYHPIIVASLLHSEFVNIHPFVDGNGRTARILLNFELMKEGYLPIIIKKSDRFKYYDALDKAALTGDYTDFVKLVVKREEEMLDLYLKLL